jgi:hypothetical protein
LEEIVFPPEIVAAAAVLAIVASARNAVVSFMVENIRIEYELNV